MIGSNELSNTRNISSIYSEFILQDGEPIHHLLKDTAFASMCDCP